MTAKLPADRLPGRLDGAPGLIALAGRYSPEQVFDLIVMCRTARSRDTDEGNIALTTLAQQMVAAEMRRRTSGISIQEALTQVERYAEEGYLVGTDATYEAARRAVAHRLGYQDVGARSNFYKIVLGGRAPDKRPHSNARGK